MYNTIRLEKGLYKLSNKSFSQVLSEMDPDTGYENTELAGLDAFERQLKRFDIRISGSDCDIVDKFFTTTESAVLFPEFVRRAIVSGMETPLLKEVVAVSTKTQSNDYRGFDVALTGSLPYGTITTEGSALPETTIKQASTSVTPAKLGRIITTTYEALRFQKLDLFAVTLKSIGFQLANGITKLAVNTLVANASTTAGTSGGFVFADLLDLYDLFACYDLTTLIASPSTCADILTLSEMKDVSSDDGGISVNVPFGPKLFKANAYTGTGVIGIDRKFALEMITSSDLILETDKLIDKQVDRIAVSICINFRKIIGDAVKVLTYTA